MEEKIDFSQIPYSYTLCLHKECPKANTCLRQLAERILPEDCEAWKFLSPRHLATFKSACPYYRSNVKVRYAKGFLQLLGNLPYNQMRTVVYNLKCHFGERIFYRLRKGERVLSPAEQQSILNILKNSGVSMPQEFDTYIEDYDW